MLGRDDDHVAALERAHHAHTDPLAAARAAFWIGINLTLRGETRAAGWFARARRLVEREGRECVEQGYLTLARTFEHAAAGDQDAAIAAAAEAAAIGERFGDADLFALAAQDQGIMLIGRGQVAEGLSLLDEAMVAVTADELSPIVNGFVYCGVITGCQAAYEPRRAREWTAALTRWCEQQPDMVSFTGACLVHRAEILQLHGDWREALDEARRARERCDAAMNAPVAAQALYRQGELHRLRGDSEAAEAAYREASRGGYEPQPGLALLRLAQGNAATAAAAIRRLLDETSGPVRRAALLPAAVEILLAAGDRAAAHGACEELAALADGGMLGALADQARGAVELAAGDPRAALVPLRRATHAWRELDAPYETARCRVLVSEACGAVGDADAAALEREAAQAAFEWLGAAPDLAGLGPDEAHGLTARELQVLRLVAVGRSNREIATALVISEHTVARHIQNVFAKLGVSSRTAASAFAFTHGLVRGQN